MIHLPITTPQAGWDALIGWQTSERTRHPLVVRMFDAVYKRLGRGNFLPLGKPAAARPSAVWPFIVVMERISWVQLVLFH